MQIKYPDGQVLEVKITPDLLGIDLVEMAAQHIKLLSYFDFKLTILENDQMRII